ncbi:P-type conjugative transfer protein TrbJ, partial [Campylobacter jejuni]|nr:P-type conjugative transfer protein TrbJ [Campylobacter jejuni]
DLITYQIDEVRKLRVTLMNQNNMLTNYLASQNNKDVLEQTKLEKQMQSDSRVPYGIGKNQNYQTDALKWK